jgi:hypothetical protein
MLGHADLDVLGAFALGDMFGVVAPDAEDVLRRARQRRKQPNGGGRDARAGKLPDRRLGDEGPCIVERAGTGLDQRRQRRERTGWHAGEPGGCLEAQRRAVRQKCCSGGMTIDVDGRKTHRRVPPVRGALPAQRSAPVTRRSFAPPVAPSRALPAILIGGSIDNIVL